MPNKALYLLTVVAIALIALLAPPVWFLLVAPEDLKTLYSAITLFTVLAAWALRQNPQGFSVVKSRVYWPIIGFIAWCGISFIWLVDTQSGEHLIMQYTLMALALFLVVNNFKSNIEIKHFLWAMILVAVLVSILGLLQYYLPKNSAIQTLVNQAIPPASTFGNKNMAAHFLVMTLPLSLLLTLYEKTLKKVALWVFASVIIGWFLMHTNTRAGWLSVGVELLFLSVFLVVDFKKHGHHPLQHNNGFHWQKLLLIVFGMLVWFVLINYTVQGFTWNIGAMGSHFNSAISHVNPRVPGLLNTLEMIKDNFLLGVGVGNWEQVYPLYHDLVEKDIVFDEKLRMQRLHNSYLEVFANVGLIGFGFLIWLLVLSVKSAYQLLQNNDTLTRYLSIAFILSLIGFSVNALFSFPLRVLTPGILVMSYLGFIANLSMRQNTVQYYRFSPHFGKLLLIPILMLGVMFSWKLYNSILSTHYVNIAQQLQFSGHRKGAFQYALKALNHNFDNVHALQMLGVVSLQIGRTQKAIEMLNRALKLRPNFNKNLLLLSAAYAKAGDKNKAIKTLERLLLVDARNVKAHAQLALIYLNNKEKSLYHYRQMLKWQDYYQGRRGFGPYDDVVDGVHKKIQPTHFVN